MSESERRHFTRFPFDGVVSFCCEGKNYTGKLLDISLKGLLMEIQNPIWKAPSPETIEFKVSLLDTDVLITFEGHVVFIKDNNIGISCEHIDLESASHLKRLVELNLGDSLLLARELHAFC